MDRSPPEIRETALQAMTALRTIWLKTPDCPAGEIVWRGQPNEPFPPTWAVTGSSAVINFMTEWFEE